ncbi:PilN family type IVB pilus formation outer membrane protein [Serratia quinivorans]|uniref:PilN family type IVB pilus formation outer membrane protein n=1 Tax=Serratia quinivorans TaxID=137545 RepID=UPI00217B0DCC|nr:PilN family type IVB pilus formation outer membrane protein [Serratia quinivorans]CAI1007823.1 Bundle-forming pilus B [Serratia quinivorans]CAI1808254.1 Bundle-forming pilus B [Serratia quinivorans]
MKLTRCAMLLGALAVSGCSIFSNYHTQVEQVAEQDRQGTDLLKKMQQAKPQFANIHQTPWVETQSVALNNHRLPAKHNCNISFATGEPMTLNGFSKLVNKLCGLPVRISPDAVTQLQAQNGNRNGMDSAGELVGIRWQGPLDGLLDVVASSLGLSWRYSNNELDLYYLDTRTFHVYAIPSETNMTSVVQSGIDAGISAESGGVMSRGGSGSDKGQSAQTTTVTLKSSMVKDIRSTVKSMLTPRVGRMAASDSTGSLTVTDVPAVLDRIQRYLDSENQAITKQVLLNVKVLSVTLDNSDQMDIDWDLVYKSKDFSTKLLGMGSSSAAGSSSMGSLGILNGGFQDSKLLINALAKQGKVSVVTSPSVTTLNLQPVPVQVATQTSYLARVESSNTANVGTSMSLTPGTVTSGFNMNLLPFIMPDNKLLLQYAINLSELKSLKEVSAGGDKSNLIQVPEVDNRIFSQKVKLESGQTLVMSGFEQLSSSADRSGTGQAANWFLGGGMKAQNKRNIIVIMISPVIME